MCMAVYMFVQFYRRPQDVQLCTTHLLLLQQTYPFRDSLVTCATQCGQMLMTSAKLCCEVSLPLSFLDVYNLCYSLRKHFDKKMWI